MYNRYIRNDDGAYRRVPHQESPPLPESREEPPPPRQRETVRSQADGFLRKLLDRLKLEDVDTGDLLLLLLLLLLFSEGEDEELLIALGLLLLL